MDSESGVRPLVVPVNRTSAPGGSDSIRRLPPAAAAGNCQRSFQYTPAVITAITTTPRETPVARRRRPIPTSRGVSLREPSAANSKVASFVPISTTLEGRFPNAATILVLGAEGTTKTVSVVRAKVRFYVDGADRCPLR